MTPVIRSIHPEARHRFDVAAQDLLEGVEPHDEPDSEEDPFPVELVLPSIADGDIIGDIEVSFRDYRGRRTGRTFLSNGKRFAINGDAYQGVIQLAHKLIARKEISRGVSSDYLESRIFDWVVERYQGLSQIPFVEYLLGSLANDVKVRVMISPLANTVIEDQLRLSKSLVAPISKKTIESWVAAAATFQSESDAAIYRRHLEERFQGRAAIYTRIEAEPIRARALALREANLIVSILATFSTAMLIPDMLCISTLLGQEDVATDCTIELHDDKHITISGSASHRAITRTWVITRSDVTRMQAERLDSLQELILGKTEFQADLLSSLLIYAKAAFTPDPLSKLIYILSSLESLLLRSESEPIQQNLAERMAITCHQTLADRRAAVKTVKDAYQVRSRYLHHGVHAADEQIISKFLLLAFVFYFNLVREQDKFATKAKYLDWIEDVKFN